MDTDIYSPSIEPLTGRETQVLDLISRGFSNREIAEELVVAPGTVKWYNKQIYRKLGVNSRTKAVAQANNAGLFEQSLEITSFPSVAYDHNLPAPLTSFIGREQEVIEITNLLNSNRLLTLTGTGGSGKSRLALRVAAEVIDQFLGGVFIVDLAPLQDSHLVLSTIAGTLDIREIHGESLIETIKHALVDKRMLLLLDNFEQVIDAALIISELLSASPDLKVLVTSREALTIYGEQVYHVPSMSIPDPEHLPPTHRLLQYESIQLFYQRATAVKPDFMITDKNDSAIAEICVRLDGLPLAIELAAARSNLYSPEMIQKRLDNRLAILSSGSRDVPIRMQTLRGTLDWSYDLLDRGEQTLLARLSVFQGGRTVDSTEAVCALGLPIDVLDGLESLLNKNLLYQEQGPLGEPRFYMLETIHEYAQEKLVESGEAEEIKLRHSQYFARLASEGEQELYGPRQGSWLDKLRVEYDNLRLAMGRSLGGLDVLLGFQIISSLRHFWYSDGLIAEGLRWSERALEYEGEIPMGIRAKVYITAADLSFIQGDYEKDKLFGLHALELAQESGDELTRAWALLSFSKSFSTSQDQVQEGIILCKESLALFRQIKNIPGNTIALNVLGELSRIADDYEGAEDYYQQCLELSRQAGDKKRVAVTLANLASIAVYHGAFQQAERLEREALEMEVELGTKYYVGLSFACLSGIVAMQGHPEQAAILLGASESVLQTMGAKLQPADQIDVDKYLISIKEQLDESSFENALAEGRGLPFEQAVSFALEKQDL
ncbi:MAG: LuxR C-terminal-related transcriptional regulator [Anaerolineales bacterium]